jgi:hypothetical protein
MKRDKVMGFKRFIKKFSLRESFKQRRMDQILDKIGKKQPLSSTEQNFLDNYENLNDDPMKDHMMMDKESTYIKITSLLEKGVEVICNLTDRNGKIGLPIIKIYSEFGSETATLELKHNEKCLLKDNFLYNIIYDPKRNEYSLEEHDEYFEKIPVNK